ncbi:Cyclic-AMP phosphodiesterase, class-II [Niveomyces insectorum RCEF 264]|uniref:Cyclic-AMP phosphodiesterase, class-II n=1 Tax=Niveomyces insectorum RCEF 264 TaxID=1081102 RepID=A0A167RII3_9HYPO|nr:Cyclic-AMP phosphodiesterase, class-II [Niveomyces insectorum RCEF 264]
MSGSGADVSVTAPSSPALQVIVLGSGGGPLESNITAFLVRSTAEGWRRGSVVALDAGVLLSSITRILEQSLPPGLAMASSRAAATGDDDDGDDNDDDDDDNHSGGNPSPASPSLPHTLTTGPFAGLEVPHATAGANALFVQSTLIDTYLITHPHLDHISGFVINTAGLPGARPKRLAGLPSTISAFKNHIFNNIIWPNLSDENNGAGLVTYMRLVEGGSPALGEGEGRGYAEISDGLAVKIWSVSHGHCIERHSHRGSGTSSRFGSIDAGNSAFNVGLGSPRIMPHHSVTSASIGSHAQPLLSSPLALQQPHQPQQPQQQQQQHQPQQQQAQQQQQTQPQQTQPLQTQQATLQPSQPQSQQQTPQRRDSLAPPSGLGGGSSSGRHPSFSIPNASLPSESVCVYDSSAYFIRDMKTGREILMFGDVEPDSVSLSPRNAQIWQEAAPKVAAGTLAAIFLECSYDDSQPVDRLYGHLTPRFVIEEMEYLAAEVRTARFLLKQRPPEHQEQPKQRERDGRKRKRYAGDDDRHSISNTSRQTSHSRRKTEMQTPAAAESGDNTGSNVPPLPDEPVSPRTLRPRQASHVSSADSSTASTTAAAAAAAATAVAAAAAVTAPAPTTTAAATVAVAARPSATPHVATPTAALSINEPASSVDPGGRAASKPVDLEAHSGERLPLQGLKVVIIHVKEKLHNGTPPGDVILNQLHEHEARSRLGCEYIVSHAGQSLYF